MPFSIFAAAADAPDHPALIAAGETFTYAALADRARRVITRLREDRLDRAPLVGLVATNDTATFATVHALITLGVPILMLHPRLTATEREALVTRHAPAAVLRPGEDSAREPVVPGDSGADNPPERTRQRAGADPPPLLDPERPLAVLFTSGTSGRPRAVVLSRRAFYHAAAASAAILGRRDDDRWLLRLPVAHVGGLSVVTRCLLLRKTVVLSDDADTRAMTQTIERDRVTILSLVPTLLTRLLDLEPAWDPPAHVRTILLGGAAATPVLLSRAADRGWPVRTTYGMTEACSQIATQQKTRKPGDLGVGQALPGTEIRIAADDEIQIRGRTLFSGYLESGDPSQGTLVRPFLDGGWFATGDRGRIDENRSLHVFGRRADRIVTGGENVDPVEVEQALERIPGVKQACVFGVPDEEWGAVVCAAVVPGAGFDPEALRSGTLADALSRDLAPFKRPRRLAIVDALTTNANGKVDRAATAKAAAPLLTSL